MALNFVGIPQAKNPRMDFHQIFRTYLPLKNLYMLMRFGVLEKTVAMAMLFKFSSGGYSTG